jgi:signal transduction histidine kinase
MVIRVSVLFYQRCCAVRDAFFRTRKQGMGTGPSLVRAIGEVHKECIWEENKTDGGGELRLSLPLVLP